MDLNDALSNILTSSIMTSILIKLETPVSAIFKKSRVGMKILENLRAALFKKTEYNRKKTKIYRVNKRRTY